MLAPRGATAMLRRPHPSAAQSAGDLGLPGRRGEEVGAFAFKWDLYKICETQQS